MAISQQIDSPLLMPLLRLTHQAEAAIARVLSDAGLRVDDWRIVDHLADRRTVPMTDLAQATLITGPTLTRTVDRLVSAGLMYRTADLQDRRRVLVSLTPRGRKLSRRLAGPVADAERAAFQGRGLDVDRLREVIEPAAAPTA